MHVSAPMHDPRFAAQLVEAQRQQSLILDADAADSCADVRTAPAYEQTVVAYDRRRYALREALTEVLGLTCPLERLHTALPHFSPRRDAHTATMADKRALLAPLTDARAAGALAEAYAALVLREMAPVIAAVTGCDELLYAAVPTVRVQTPSDLATIRPHVDGMYDLPRGAANVWVPLTGPLEPSATLQLESAPGLADFAPLLPPNGAAVLFDGRQRRQSPILHYYLLMDQKIRILRARTVAALGAA